MPAKIQIKAFRINRSLLQAGLVALAIGSSGCNLLPRNPAGAQASPTDTRPAVDVAVARPAPVSAAQEFIGTTKPVREVALRSQVEGRLLRIDVNVGDAVVPGQILAQLDDTILFTSVSQAEAQLAALEAEVTRAESQVSAAEAQAEQTRAQLEQAQRDADRLSSLASQGAIAAQQAENARTALRSQEQVLAAAIARISSEQENVAASFRRVEAQRAVVAQTRERQALTTITAPIAGVVLERTSEPGNLIQPGGEILKLGDFSSIKVVVPVSELNLNQVRLGGNARLRLDAFPNLDLRGQITSVSPAADPTARQIPVEVTLTNPNRRITGGLLARVSFGEGRSPRISVPVSAIPQLSERRGGRPASPTPGTRTPASPGQPRPPSSPRGTPNQPREVSLFVLTGEGDNAQAVERKVRVSEPANGRVEIISGLESGDRYISRSTAPLKNGDRVRVSAVSER